MKYALVTGSTRGIGKGIADKLVQKEYIVFRNGRNENQDFSNYIQADLSSMAGVDALVQTVAQCNVKLDCLILNAGATCRKSLTDITYSDWQTVMDTNINIPFFLIQQMLPYMADGGSILFVSSAMALRPHATSLPYGVSKAAVNMLAQSLVKELAPRGIRVNSICPGFIDTEWQKEKPQWLREKIAKKTALNRFGTVEEVADMCVSLCENTFMNGAVVSIDGGYDMK